MNCVLYNLKNDILIEMETSRKDKEQIKQDLVKMKLQYAKLQKKLSKSKAREHVKKRLKEQDQLKTCTEHAQQDKSKTFSKILSLDKRGKKSVSRRSVSFRLEKDSPESGTKKSARQEENKSDVSEKTPTDSSRHLYNNLPSTAHNISPSSVIDEKIESSNNTCKSSNYELSETVLQQSTGGSKDSFDVLLQPKKDFTEFKHVINHSSKMKTVPNTMIKLQFKKALEDGNCLRPKQLQFSQLMDGKDIGTEKLSNIPLADKDCKKDKSGQNTFTDPAYTFTEPAHTFTDPDVIESVAPFKDNMNEDETVSNADEKLQQFDMQLGCFQSEKFCNNYVVAYPNAESEAIKSLTVNRESHLSVSLSKHSSPRDQSSNSEPSKGPRCGVIVKRRRSRRSKALTVEDVHMKSLSQGTSDHTLIEGLIYPVEYYVRETRSMKKCITQSGTTLDTEKNILDSPLTPKDPLDLLHPSPMNKSFPSQTKFQNSSCVSSQGLLESQCTQSQASVGDMPPLGESPMKVPLGSKPSISQDGVNVSEDRVSTVNNPEVKNLKGNDRSNDPKDDPNTNVDVTHCDPCTVNEGQRTHQQIDQATIYKTGATNSAIESPRTTGEGNNTPGKVDLNTTNNIQDEVDYGDASEELFVQNIEKVPALVKGLSWEGCLQVEESDVRWLGVCSSSVGNWECILIHSTRSLVLWVCAGGTEWVVLCSWDLPQNEEIIHIHSLTNSADFSSFILAKDQHKVVARILKYNLASNDEKLITVDLPHTLTPNSLKAISHDNTVVLVNQCSDRILQYHGLFIHEEYCKSISMDPVTVGDDNPVFDIIPVIQLKDVFLIVASGSLTLWSVSSNTCLGNFPVGDWDLRRCYWVKAEKGLLFFLAYVDHYQFSSSQSSGLALMALNPSSGKMVHIQHYRMSCMHQEAGINQVHVSSPFVVALFNDGSILWWDLYSSKCLTEVPAGNQDPFSMTITDSHLVTMGTCVQVYKVNS